MNEAFLQELLLIEAPAVKQLYTKLNEIAQYFVPPMFIVGIVLEFFTEMKFLDVLKKLLLVIVFMNFFYSFHTYSSRASLKASTQILHEVSPNNLFVRQWIGPKVETQEKSTWGWIKSIVVPNLNDLVGTTLYVMCQVFLWLLKLIYSTVFHLTYVFSGLTAILFFMGWTKDALKGTVQASIWCIVFPLVVVAILALVGGSISQDAQNGHFVAGDIDQLIWLFGITLLLLFSPAMAYGMVKGDGIHAFGGKLGQAGMLGINQITMSANIFKKGVQRIQRHRNLKTQALKRSEGNRYFNKGQRNVQQYINKNYNNRRKS